MAALVAAVGVERPEEPGFAIRAIAAPCDDHVAVVAVAACVAVLVHVALVDPGFVHVDPGFVHGPGGYPGHFDLDLDSAGVGWHEAMSGH